MMVAVWTGVVAAGGLARVANVGLAIGEHL